MRTRLGVLSARRGNNSRRHLQRRPLPVRYLERSSTSMQEHKTDERHTDDECPPKSKTAQIEPLVKVVRPSLDRLQDLRISRRQPMGQLPLIVTVIRNPARPQYTHTANAPFAVSPALSYRRTSRTAGLWACTAGDASERASCPQTSRCCPSLRVVVVVGGEEKAWGELMARFCIPRPCAGSVNSSHRRRYVFDVTLVHSLFWTAFIFLTLTTSHTSTNRYLFGLKGLRRLCSHALCLLHFASVRLLAYHLFNDIHKRQELRRQIVPGRVARIYVMTGKYSTASVSLDCCA